MTSNWGDLTWLGDVRPAEDAPTSQEAVRELLLLESRGDTYAVPVERVREIVRVGRVTPVPNLPAEVCGVIALRGEIVQVLDLARCLGRGSGTDAAPTLPAPDAAPPRSARGFRSSRPRIVILQADAGRMSGLRVDRVLDVWRAPEAAFRPAETATAPLVEALVLRDERFVSVLDVDRILGLEHAEYRGPVR